MAALTHDAGAAPRQPRSFGRSLGMVALVVAAIVGLTNVSWTDLLPSVGNPFSTSTVDRTAPAVLAALDDVSEHHAARATYQVIVDAEDDTRFVPSFIKGEREVMTATGSVDAVVDLARLGEDDIRVDGRRVVITLPGATLAEPRLDPEHSRVVARDRGIVDRLGSVFSDSPTSDRDLYLLAESKLTTAAAADGELVTRAQRNTGRMLERLLEPLGFDEVVVRFSSTTG